MKHRTGSSALLVAILGLLVLFASLPGACTKEVVKEVPVERVVEKEVIKEVPVERVVEKEVIREVPVERVVIKEVPVTPRPPIKVGILMGLTGPFAGPSSESVNGAQLFFDEVGHKIAQRNVEVIVEDTKLQTDIALTKIRKLSEVDGIHALIGPISSAVAYALRDYVDKNKLPLLTNVVARDLTLERRSPYVFRSTYAAGQVEGPLVWWVNKNMGAKKILAIAVDYAAGHETIDAMKRTLGLLGGQIVDAIYVPVGTADFAPYMVDLKAKAANADLIFGYFLGADAIRFITQYADYGLKVDKLIANEILVDDSLLPAQGKAALGVINVGRYAATLDTPENKAFIKSYTDKYKAAPTGFSEAHYISAKMIAQAAEAIGGDVEDTPRFLEALRNVKFEAARGPFRLDSTQNVILNAYIRQVKEVNGQLKNVVIDTIPDVDIAWTPPK